MSYHDEITEGQNYSPTINILKIGLLRGRSQYQTIN